MEFKFESEIKFNKENNMGLYEEVEYPNGIDRKVLRSCQFEKVGDEIKIIGIEVTDYADETYGCTKVEIPEKIMDLPVTEIAPFAADKSNSNIDITGVTFPKTLKKIGEGAFSSFCDFDEVEIPETVEEIYAHAFGYDYYTVPPKTAGVYEKLDLTIICAPGSAAEKYAKYNGFPTKPIAK